jgi:hypothetical protein
MSSQREQQAGHDAQDGKHGPVDAPQQQLKLLKSCCLISIDENRIGLGIGNDASGDEPIEKDANDSRRRHRIDRRAGRDRQHF